MKTRCITTLLFFVLLGRVAVSPANAVDAAYSVNKEAQKTAVVFFDPGEVEVSLNATIINNVPYVSFREFMLRIGVTQIYGENRALYAATPSGIIRAEEGLEYITVGERYVLAVPGCCLDADSGDLLSPLCSLTEAIGAQYTRLNTANVIFISGNAEPAARKACYTEEDLYWMSRIIQAEAGGEPLVGKVAVGNVVMNRINDPSCPDSVRDVIFDNRTGVQFTPAYSGAINNTPSEESIIAAKIAMTGGNVAGASLFFSSKYEGCWAKRNRPFAMDIGNHAFYY